MRKRKLTKRRQSLETMAAQVHDGLKTARQLYDNNDPSLAYVMVRELFPLAVFVASRRWQETANYSAKYDMARVVRAFGTTKRLTGVSYERVHKAASPIVAMGWEGPQDVDTVLHAANHLLRHSGSDTAKLVRFKVARVDRKEPSAVRRWSTAACTLVTFGWIGGAS